jgi:hypothetical protein
VRSRRATARYFWRSGSLALLLPAKLALAQSAASSASPFSLEVARDDEAVSCPDQTWVEKKVADHAGDAEQAGKFSLRLSKRGEAWHARIQRWEPGSGEPAAQRVLEDRSSACTPLAEAAALTLALLAEGFAHDEAQARERVVAPPVEPEPARAVEPPEHEPSHPLEVWVGAGGGAALSWISPLAPLLGFGAGMDSAQTRHGLRVMLTTEQKFELVPGRVVVQAWLGTLFSCWRFERGQVGAALCATGDVSLLRASAEGFADGRPSSRLYGSAGLEAQPGWRISKNYRLSAALAALVPFSRESFSVTGRGVAYVPPSLNWRVLLISELGAF